MRKSFKIRIYYRKLSYDALTSIISIYNVSRYPTYQKSPLMRKLKTYDQTYKIVRFHQSYKKCLHCMFSRFLFFLVTTRYDAFTRSYEFMTFLDTHP